MSRSIFPETPQTLRLFTSMGVLEVDVLGFEIIARKCPHCGDLFEPNDPRQVYCKPGHRSRAYEHRQILGLSIH